MLIEQTLERAVHEFVDRLAAELTKRLVHAMSAELSLPRHPSIPEYPQHATKTVSKVLAEGEVEREYSLSKSWLRRKRVMRDGPPFLKIGKMVRYPREDIEAYLAHATIPARPVVRNRFALDSVPKLDGP